MEIEKSVVIDVEAGRQRVDLPGSAIPSSHSKSQLEVEVKTSVSDDQQVQSRSSWSSRLPSPWWWWWEIGASAISIVSMVLLVAFLACINHTAVSAWQFLIRPNAIVSFISTVARTAMMVPVASSINQLKWRHYLCGPNQLNHLQIFDDASRGPIGALKAIFNTGSKASLIMALAAVTLLSLAVGPTAQLMLNFIDYRSPVKDGTGQIAVAYNYETCSTDSEGFVTPNAYMVRSALMRAMIGEVLQPSMICGNATNLCTWNEITTLAVCSDTRNVTGQVKPMVRGGPPDNSTNSTAQTRYTYLIPRILGPRGSANTNGQIYLRDLEIDLAFARQESNETEVSPDDRPLVKTLFNSTAVVEPPGQNQQGYNGGVSYAYVRLQSNGWVIERPDYEPEPEIFVTRWYYCSQTFRDVEGGINQQVRGRMVAKTPLRYISSTYFSNTTDRGFSIYSDKSGTQQYNISFGTTGTLFHTLANLLQGKVLQIRAESGSWKPKVMGTDDDPSSGQFLYSGYNDVRLLENIALAATNLIRSNAADNHHGDNSQILMVTGELFSPGVAFVVRWEWVVVPVIEVVAVALLLGISIQKTSGQPLLKGSVVAYLLHGLQGWTDSELDALLPAEETAESLEEVSKGMTASLARDDNERYMFKRVKEELEHDTAIHMIYSQQMVLGDISDNEDIVSTREAVRH